MTPLPLAESLLFVGALALLALPFVTKRVKRNRRVGRSAWPRKGTIAPRGSFADRTKSAVEQYMDSLKQGRF